MLLYKTQLMIMETIRIAIIEVCCPHCESALVYKHGKAPTGLQRYCCRDCKQSFQYEYRYEANKKEPPKKSFKWP